MMNIGSMMYLNIFENKRSLDISEIEELFASKKEIKSNSEIESELKHYCNHRGTKYSLKIFKE